MRYGRGTPLMSPVANLSAVKNSENEKNSGNEHPDSVPPTSIRANPLRKQMEEDEREVAKIAEKIEARNRLIHRLEMAVLVLGIIFASAIVIYSTVR